MAPTNTVGGGVDQTAILGHAPEHRGWTPGDPSYDVQLGEGARIEAFVTVDAGYKRPTRIGARCWLMKHVRVGHDAVSQVKRGGRARRSVPAAGPPVFRRAVERDDNGARCARPGVRSSKRRFSN
jgi:hypothetical protein